MGIGQAFVNTTLALVILSRLRLGLDRHPLSLLKLAPPLLRWLKIVLAPGRLHLLAMAGRPPSFQEAWRNFTLPW